VHHEEDLESKDRGEKAATEEESKQPEKKLV